MAKVAGRTKSLDSHQNDLNVGQLTMGHWTTAAMRKPKASTGSKGRASRKFLKPPEGGWKGDPTK